LEKVAENVQVTLKVTKRTGVWHKPQHTGQTINHSQILSVTMPVFLFVASGLSAYPRAYTPEQLNRLTRPARRSAFRFLHLGISKDSIHVESTEARMAHQFGHAVDDNYGVIATILFLKYRKKSRGVLTIHYVDNEDDVGAGDISLDPFPFVYRKWRTEVVANDL
jgi:hypothetical protein